MTFGEKLNEYFEIYGFTGKDLAEASSLSPAVISRYRSETRIPTVSGQQIKKLATGIASLALLSGKQITSEEIFKELSETLQTEKIDFEVTVKNINLLFRLLNINVNQLSRYLNYDASYISRIRNGQRKPAEPEVIINGICHYISENCTSMREKTIIANLTEKDPAVFNEKHSYFSAVHHWLYTEKPNSQNGINDFLHKIDHFDLNDYIRSIHFDEIKVPSIPFQHQTTKKYIGIKQMGQGELDFFKATVLSHSREPVFMCTDMDMADMAEDIEFGKKWMFAIAVCIKKGLHFNIIHSLDRPFAEMMLGLESWIPIYMTGQISPFYLKDAKSSTYQHLTYVSGAVALSGECITGHHKRGKYYLTKKSDEVEYYREKSNFILNKAHPLMEIYSNDQRLDFYNFLSEDTKTTGYRHGILSSPPIFSIPDKLLKKILTRNNIPPEKQQEIQAYVQTRRELMEEIINNTDNTVYDELSCLSPQEMEEYPVYLSLEGLFYPIDISYSYEEYKEHLKATADYADKHKNYTVSFNLKRAFRRIQIYIHENKYVIVSKGKAPTIHFVIRHNKLRKAFENLVLPITED